MYQVFVEKIAKIISMGVYQRAFELPLPSFNKPNETSVEDDIIKMLKGFFLTLVYNDPLIRYSIKNYFQWMMSMPQSSIATISPETLLTYSRLMEIHREWAEFIDSSRITDFVSMLFTQRVFTRVTNPESGSLLEWNKPLWFETLSLHIKQICEF